VGAHLIENEFQSDKYPTTPRGKVPLSVKDVTAQDLLYAYAQRRRAVDAEFADDLEAALDKAGYKPGPYVGGTVVIECADETHLIPRTEVRHVEICYAPTEHGGVRGEWILRYTLANAGVGSILFAGDRRSEAVRQSVVAADEYNRIAARTMKNMLTRGAHDLRIVLLADGQWHVMSADGRHP